MMNRDMFLIHRCARKKKASLEQQPSMEYQTGKKEGNKIGRPRRPFITSAGRKEAGDDFGATYRVPRNQKKKEGSQARTHDSSLHPPRKKKKEGISGPSALTRAFKLEGEKKKNGQ